MSDASTAGIDGVRHGGSVLRPGIRTFKPRRSRITQRQSQALEAQPPWLLPSASDEPLDLAALWGAGVPVVAEIGFGMGSPTAAMAQADPATGVLAIDIHTPGVGDLLAEIHERNLANIRVIEADALGVLSTRVGSHALAGLRSYFPDPWPKARHFKRRLVQPAVLDLAWSRLASGGSWHLATDWSEYAGWMQEVFAGDPKWQGGIIERPAWRPVTGYERRALREGRQIVDLLYRTA